LLTFALIIKLLYLCFLLISKKNWIAAIKKDQLEWPYHVSELTKWDSKAGREYGVRGIPKTFLIDRQGKIAAVNPRLDLEEQLLKIL